MSSRVALPVLAFALQLVPQATAQQAAVSEDVALRIEERCNELLWGLHEKHGFPGLSAALVLPDGTELAFPVGFADLEAGREMSAEDRLLSGSIGKTYVSAAAHHLMLAGKLDFAAKAIEHFEGEEWFLRVPNARTVTVAQLLRHESGLPRYVFEAGFFPACIAEPDKVWKPEELLSWVFDDAPLFPAGEGWAYSDTNYIVVGMILEKVAGMPFYDYVRKNLLEPHRLADTVPSDSRRIPGLTQGYCVALRQFGMPERMLTDGVFCYNPQFEWCGGGYASTPLDLARWARLLYGGEAMEGDYLASMLDTVPARLGPGVEYGLGAMTRASALGRQIGHDGVMTGFLASVGWFEASGISGAVMANTDDASALGMPADRLLERLAAIAQDELDG